MMYNLQSVAALLKRLFILENPLKKEKTHYLEDRVAP